MAKINHNSYHDTVNDLLEQAQKKGVMYLENSDDMWLGNHMQMDGRKLVNFGTCGYLGLETNSQLIRKSLEYTAKYGTQFSISRAYVISQQNRTLEEELSKIFDGHNVLVYSSTTLTHMSVLPVIIGARDAVIIDRQAHFSMQTVMKLVEAGGVPSELIRHNNMEMLEDRIKALKDKHDKIWYVIDGVYSMYGDLPPYEELNELARRYPQLHFYADDAHGMSWSGVNGRGCAFERLACKDRAVIISTMAKGFGSVGGMAIFPDEATYTKVLRFGGPLSYSHPIAPGVMGASMASAQIHNSDEILSLQHKLRENLKYCNELLSETDIPVLSNPDTPIFFVGTGEPKVGYNLNKRILDAGYYVNLGIFPAVAIKNTGLRFTVTNHVSKEDIKNFVEAIEYHYPQALKEERRTLNEIRSAFSLPNVETRKPKSVVHHHALELTVAESVTDFSRELWNEVMNLESGCSYDNLQMIEKIYSGNDLLEDNAEFLYYIVRDKSSGKVVCCTLFSLMLMKDDMFEPMGKSIGVESTRQYDPYYLTSRTYFMGTMLTEGNHLYIDYNTDWKSALRLILDHLSIKQVQKDVNNVILRDFDASNEPLKEHLYDLGFAKIDLPNSNIIYNLDEYNEEAFYLSLSSRNRRHIRDDVFRYQKELSTEICNELSEEEILVATKLLQNVTSQNLAVNLFDFPEKMIHLMNDNRSWEFIKIYLKDQLVAIGFCHQLNKNYYPMLVGLDYEVNASHKVYKQMLYQVVMRAIKLNCERVFFGLSADTEKKKLGAQQCSRIGFISILDNYNFEILTNMSVNEKPSL